MTTITFRVPKGPCPDPGDNLATPVEGGMSWLEFGTFTAAVLDGDHVELTLELADGLGAFITTQEVRP